MGKDETVVVAPESQRDRDKIMFDYSREHPGYGWERNKGYPTPEHVEALGRLGPTVHHRRSFAPVRQLTLGL